MRNLESAQQDPLAKTKEFKPHYNMFKAINIALAVFLAFEKSLNISRREFVLEYLSQHNPSGKELYHNILLRHDNEALTCLNYVHSLLSLKRSDGQIYIADIPGGGLHFVYVFTIDGQRYYLEPQLISDQMIKIQENQLHKNQKYTILINNTSQDNSNFSSFIRIATGRSVRYDFRPLEIPSQATEDFIGYLTLKYHLYSKTQVFISNRHCEKLEAISLNGQKKLAFILPNDKEVGLLVPHAIICEPERPGFRFTMQIENLEHVKAFITDKFGSEIYDDLIQFRENISLLEKIQSYYPENMSLL